MKSVFFVAALCVAAAGCGGGGEGSTNSPPTINPPSVSRIKSVTPKEYREIPGISPTAYAITKIRVQVCASNTSSVVVQPEPTTGAPNAVVMVGGQDHLYFHSTALTRGDRVARDSNRDVCGVIDVPYSLMMDWKAHYGATPMPIYLWINDTPIPATRGTMPGIKLLPPL